MTFDQCWEVYPHYQGRSKKAISRAKYDAITTEGLKTFAKDESGNRVALMLQCSPETMLEACKAQAIAVGSERQDVLGWQIFLNQGRFEDWSPSERLRMDRQSDERGANRTEQVN